MRAGIEVHRLQVLWPAQAVEDRELAHSISCFKHFVQQSISANEEFVNPRNIGRCEEVPGKRGLPFVVGDIEAGRDGLTQ